MKRSGLNLDSVGKSTRLPTRWVVCWTRFTKLQRQHKTKKHNKNMTAKRKERKIENRPCKKEKRKKCLSRVPSTRTSTTETAAAGVSSWWRVVHAHPSAGSGSANQSLLQITSRYARDGTVEPVSRDQILRRYYERGQRKETKKYSFCLFIPPRAGLATLYG